MKTLLLFCLLFLSACATEDDDDVEGIPVDQTPVVTILSQQGSVAVSVELARTIEEQQQGLKFRNSLGEFSGMLFLFNFEAFVSFTMEDTFIPLDIIFIDSTFRVVDIEKNTIPETSGPYFSTAPFMYALEVNAGFSDRFSIQVGDRVSFTGFDF